MKLTKKEISHLSNQFKNANALSIFSNISDRPDGSEQNSLLQKGIMQGSTLTSASLDMLNSVATPEKSSRLVLQNSSCIIEKYTYRKGNTLLLAENDNGDMLFSKPEDLSQVVIDVSEFTGMSKISSSAITLVLSPDELILLLALVDCYRIRYLQSYSDLPKPLMNVSKNDWKKSLTYLFKNGLCQILVKNYNFKVPDASSVDAIISRLVEKKLINELNGVTLNAEFDHIAQKFLVLETLLMYETFTLIQDGSLLSVGRLCVCAGIHNILSFMFDGENIELNTVSGLQLVTNIEDFLKCPDMPTENTTNPVPANAPNVSATSVNTSWICQCGTNCTAKFCPNCGKQRS